MMTTADTTVRDLLNALDAILRAADQNNMPFIQGVAEQAIKNSHARMVRNSDGYLVVRQ